MLNGHNEATAALIDWAARSGDPLAVRLARKALVALHTTTALEQISFPTGLASSYDLLRGWPAAPVRAVSAKGLTVRGADVVGPGGTSYGSATIAVQKAGGPARNLVRNSGFTAWKGRTPVGWTVTGAGAGAGVYGTVRRGGVPRSVRITADPGGHVVVQQDLPKVTRATRFTVSWTASLARSPGVDSRPGDVVLQAVCGRRATNVAVADVRSPLRVQERISGQIRAGCTPRVKLYQSDGGARADVTYADVAVRVSDAVGTARAPRYPVSVVDVPTVSLRVRYSGSGWLQAWWCGQWTTLGYLRSTADLFTA